MSNKRVYLDYASLTPVDRRVLTEMKKYSSPEYANPSSLYKEGVSAKNALNDARKRCAGAIRAHDDEIIFTSGGTESNNIAISGIIESLREQGMEYSDMRILVSAIEHSSVRECANHWNGKGVTIDVVEVDKNGVVSLEDLKKKIKINTAIVSIMMVNNEVGTVQPIREIAKIIRRIRQLNASSSAFSFQTVVAYPLFHTDAAQAAPYQELNMEQLGVDMMTLDGTKICGPRGVGALYVRRNTPVSPVIFGGGQERGLRSGTENLPGIMGFTKALEMAVAGREKETRRIGQLKKHFLEGLRKIKPDITVQGEAAETSPHILNVSIPKINNEFFVLQLDAAGMACSTKSSCLRDEDESYVLKSMGADSRTSVRFSFGRQTDKVGLDMALKAVKGILNR